MFSTCKSWLDDRRDFIIVMIAEVAGSSPRGPGTWMAVSNNQIIGTIGGGRLEWDAIAQARQLLVSGQTLERKTVTLGPDIGQCCGGKVTLQFNSGNPQSLAELNAVYAKEHDKRPSVYLFGAGHVGRALATALAPLPLNLQLIDSREEELKQFTMQNIKKMRIDSPASIVEDTPSNAAYVVMTHSHSLDSLIASAVLEKGTFRYLGIIGSKTKRASFLNAFQAMGIPIERISRVVCPIGGNAVSDKRPEVIAALTAAEIVAAVFS
jgi:xanthine dehydrogenase accessory factor